MSMRGCLLEAARVFSEVRAKKGAVKALVLSSSYSNKRQLLAIVCEALKYSSILQEVIQKCGIKADDESLSLVLLYEHLVGRGLRNAGSIRKIVTSKREPIKQFVASFLAQRGVDSLQDLLPAECRSKNGLQMPRYARVNTLKMSCEDACSRLAEEGWELCGAQDVCEWLDGKPPGNRFIMDPLLQNVLVFPPGTELHDHLLCLDGCLILQDRASCFPAYVLQPDQHCTAIDCCAAPGNKTTHMASLMGNTGTIYAFDRDENRLQTLKSMLKRAGVTNTRAECRDFLTIPPTQPPYCQAQYILLDPSCSGSGMVGRMNHLTDDKHSTNPSRLRSLSRFQIFLLKHALSFPRVRRVVYSTCSIHADENEAVVQEVLDQVRSSFSLRNILPEWSRRGLHEFECGPHCVRTSPQDDLTNGFFVACFERKSADEEKELGGGVNESACIDSDDLMKEDDETACAGSAGKKSSKSEKRRKNEKEKKSESEEELEGALKGCQTCSDGLAEGKVKRLKKKKKKRKENSGTTDERSDRLMEGHTSCSDGLADVQMEKPKKGKKKRDKKRKLESRAADEVAVSENLHETSGQNFDEETTSARGCCAPEHGTYKKRGKKRKRRAEKTERDAAESSKKMRRAHENVSANCELLSKKGIKVKREKGRRKESSGVDKIIK